MPGLVRELDIACGLARRAGAEIEAVRARGFRTRLKADDSPVTRADLAADRLLRAGLSEAFPNDALLSEEGGGLVPGTSGRTWIIDPLDGTRAFVAGGADYAVQVGLLDRTTPVLGVLYEPAAERLYSAIRGGGAFIRSGPAGPSEPAPIRLRVSARREYDAMRLVTSTQLSEGDRRRLIERLGMRGGGAAHSVGIKVGMLVRGEADVYLSLHPVNLWDSCAPLVVLEAAGGRMTLLDGRPLLFDIEGGRMRHRGPLLASNGTRHDHLAPLVSALLGSVHE